MTDFKQDLLKNLHFNLLYIQAELIAFLQTFLMQLASPPPSLTAVSQRSVTALALSTKDIPNESSAAKLAAMNTTLLTDILPHLYHAVDTMNPLVGKGLTARLVGIIQSIKGAHSLVVPPVKETLTSLVVPPVKETLTLPAMEETLATKSQAATAMVPPDNISHSDSQPRSMEYHARLCSQAAAHVLSLLAGSANSLTPLLIAAEKVTFDLLKDLSSKSQASIFLNAWVRVIGKARESKWSKEVVNALGSLTRRMKTLAVLI